MMHPLDEILQRSSLFRFLPEDDSERLRALLREERFGFGDVIVREGDEADAFYLLTSGRARVVKETETGEEIALATLRPGDEFGETALLDGGTRNATVRCSTSVDVMRLDRTDFLPLLAQFPALKKSIETTARFRELHGFLYEFSNFGRLPARALGGLIESLSPVESRKGEILIREGDSAGPMFIVASGRVRAFAQNNGRSRNLAFYRTGDYFGELSILNGSPRAASAEAVTDCRLLTLAPDAVRDLKERFPEFRRLLDERLAQYQANVEARIPLDFGEELLPAETRAHNKTEGAEELDDEPFADERGLFRKRKKRIRRIPHVQQIDEMDCGAASLAMICRHFGREVSLAHIRQLCHTSCDGTSLKALCQAATELGLAARALKVSLRNLPHLPLPAIAHWEGNHWIVLYDVTDSHVRVEDPGLGARLISREEFEAKWSGYAALFDYTDAFENAPQSRGTLALLAPFFRRHKAILVQVLLLAGIVTFLQLLFPVFTQVVVDKVIVENDVKLLTAVLLAMGAAIVFSQIANLLEQYLTSFAAVRIDTAILDFLTRNLLSLPMSYFHSRRTGDIQRRLDGARQVRLFAVQHGIGGALSLITLIGALCVMAVYSFALAGVFLITMPLYALLMVWSSKVLRPLFADIEESQGKYASHQIDAIKGIEAVKAASAELVFRDTMLNEFLSVSRKMFRSNFILMSYDGVLQTIGLLATVLFLWVGASKVIAGEITVGAFVAFSSLTAMAYAAILRTLGIWDQWQFIAVLINRLNDIFEHEPEQGRDRSRLTPVHSLEGHIALRNVGFKYGGPEAPDILHGINLEIPHGKIVAIVGRSGSGKTTLIKLLAGLLEPTEGTILFDRADLKTLNYRDVRRQIGMVLQDNHMFSETIVRNIAFGDPEPDFDRVLWCAQIANAHEFIMRLPIGYETRVGESGIALSGGQKQRVAIARALYADPPILIFDEATSALDTESERAIQENLSRMMGGRTCIVIAHRLSTIRDADLIVVLEKGGVAERGAHDELMARRGLYFHLSSQQLGI
ncbi:MAG: peptidase domain-containing ABC transporter [Chthoniobacteraceae bacterium]